MLGTVKEIAKEKKCTPSQLAIAWTIANGSLPIPGTKRISYLEANIASLEVDFTAEDLVMLTDSAFGGRY